MTGLKIGKQSLVFSHDLFMVAVAWLGAYWLRFNLGYVPQDAAEQALLMLPVLLPIQAVFFVFFGLYRGVWRFASIPDLIRISKSVLIGSLIAITIIFLLTRMENIPRSVFPIYGILLLTLLGGPRLIYRLTRDWNIYKKDRKYVLLVGAGEAGEMLARNMLRDSERHYVPSVFVDDSKPLHGKELHGIRIAGGVEDIPELVIALGIDLVVIALPSATSEEMRRIVDYCAQCDVPFRTLPRMQDLLSGQVTVSELREISIEDLLGREPVTIDLDSIHNGVTDKVVLVTGGGGSIGQELCVQIAKFSPSALIILEHNEYNLFSVTRKLRTMYPELVVISRLGSVSDAIFVDNVMTRNQPQVIFHAAAYKHVPILQNHLRDAVLNNVIGTKIIAEAADRCRCEIFALISTDKAVNPLSVMGATKRIAEIYCHDFSQRSSTRFITVRFGNVLDSAGSVVPIFREQIKSGGPLLVTHPDVSRFFMTIPEACQLILQAALMGEGGEIFVLDMGEPVKIRYLAEEMIRLSGRAGNDEIEIIYTGLTPGEKMHEELFYHHETPVGTSNPKILLAHASEMNSNRLKSTMERLEAACAKFDEKELANQITLLMPVNFNIRPSGSQSIDDKVVPFNPTTKIS